MSTQTNLILENATDGILTIDDEQKIVRFNPACEKIWGYSAEEVLGKEITVLIPEYARKDHLDNVHSFRNSRIEGCPHGRPGTEAVWPDKGRQSCSGRSRHFNGRGGWRVFLFSVYQGHYPAQKAEKELLKAKEAAEVRYQSQG